jgi:hypothetical protein
MSRGRRAQLEGKPKRARDKKRLKEMRVEVGLYIGREKDLAD